jgi:predicted ester cyclase
MDERVDLVHRYFDLWLHGDADRVDALVTSDYIDHNKSEWAPGGADLKAEVREFHAAFSDVRGQVEEVLPDGEWVAFRATLDALQTEVFRGMPPGERLVLHGIEMLRIEGGRIAELWGNEETLKRYPQLRSAL